jgi:hypothetical protein
MERVTEISEKTLALLFENYTLWVGLLSLILIFAIYLYLSPSAPFEGFSATATARTKQENTRKHQ